MNLIFDLDGTIIDSHQGIAYSFNEAYLKVFNKHNTIDLHPLIGPPLVKMIDELMPEISLHDKQTLISSFMPHYDSIGYKKTTLFTEAKNTLEILSQQHVLYIATNKRYLPTLQILEYLNISAYFGDRVFALDKINPKYESKPKMVEDILILYNLDSKNTALIGDTSSDKNAAQENNLRFIHAHYGYEKQLEAKEKIETIAELLNLF